MALLERCANVGSLTGGEKDTAAPKILTAKPGNESVNFQGNSIELEFDEYVQLKNANSELIVSPPFNEPVEFKMKGKTVTLTWKDTLQASTTYLFQFGSGIADVNESNVLDSNIFVFSTGAYLDSFELRGRVVDAKDLKPADEVWVMLYSGVDDSLPYLSIPKYFAKTDKSGQFHMRYLQPGSYKAFALKALNPGYLFDMKDEPIGFLDAMIDSYNAKDTNAVDTQINFSIFIQDDSTQYLKSFSQVQNQGLFLEFNRPVVNFKMAETSGMKTEDWTMKWNKDLDSLVIWFDSSLTYDSLKLQIQADQFRDTVFFRKPNLLAQAKRGGKANENSDKLSFKLNFSGKIPHYKSLSATSKVPIQSFDGLSKLVLTQNGDTVNAQTYLRTDFYSMHLDYPWKQDSKYQLLIPDSCILDRFGRFNDTILWNFTTTRKEDFGQLSITHRLPNLNHGYVWQLLNSEFKLIEQRIVNAEGKVEYDYLPTGTYRIKIIFDKNNNGQWDSGFYPKKRQPEKVVYFDEAIEIRSNWSSELEWNYSESKPTNEIEKR